MAQWLQKLLGLPDKPGTGTNLTVRNDSSGALGPVRQKPEWQQVKGGIPNASLIYGATAILLFAVSIYHLFHGRYLIAFLVLFLVACFVGYAWYFYKNAGRN